ncbi:MAG: hypothetical protein COA78_20085 [Blastopirellula sp.]|nr:MAG: hypothetical protein COA78_20085 [Blastopirellula sp.]
MKSRLEASGPKPLQVTLSKKSASLTLTGGLLAVTLGLALEFYIYPTYERHLEGVIVINGWFFTAFGGLFTWIGINELLMKPVHLDINQDGIHSPRVKVSIPWDKILNVRYVSPPEGGGGASFCLVKVNDPELFSKIKRMQFKHWAFKHHFEPDEVPIFIPPFTIDEATLLATINSFRDSFLNSPRIES